MPGRRRRGLLFLHESRELLRIAGPIILAQLGGVGMNTMDTIMVGPLGAEALAAVGLGSALHIATLILCMGILLGMAPLVSQAFGAGDREECRRVLVQGLWLAVMLTLPIAWLTAEGERLTLALGQAPEIAELVGGYMWALIPGIAPFLLFMAFRQFLEGMGLTKPAMVITFVGLAVNYLGNRVLIYGIEGWVPAMGVVGSGWATTIVRTVMLLAMVLYLVRHPDLHPLRGIGWGIERVRLRRIVGIGAPIGAQLGLEVGLFSLAAVMMGWFGPLELGTHQVTINIASTTFMVALGVSLAGSIRVGQHIGAGSGAGVHRATLVTYALALGFMGLCALLFLAVPEGLIGLYTRDPEIIRLGSMLLLVAAFFQLFDGAQVAGLSVLRGAADTRIPMLIAALAYWGVGVPAAYLLGFHSRLGPVGVWAGLCLALAVAGALLGWRVWRVVWGSRVAPVARPRESMPAADAASAL
ncbi:MAG: MATE family efflux transporter [Gemmatimonadetes bacterium]|nr:MATE family efflux transporter [Gemmatimonadota bacterium]